jgi:hypothetical protein
MVLTYKQIYKAVNEFSKAYQKNHIVFEPPSKIELIPYENLLNRNYSGVVKLVKKYLRDKDSPVTHGFPHLLNISLLSGLVAENEIKLRNLVNLKEEIMETTLLGGLLHDIDRDLGYGEEHAIKGEKTAEEMLKSAGIKNTSVPLLVRHHDDLKYFTNNPILLLATDSVFDADHFWYGWEREKLFWERGEKKGTPFEEIIHDYKFLPKYKNTWRTGYGRKVGPNLIDYGLAIAMHIEDKFS